MRKMQIKKSWFQVIRLMAVCFLLSGLLYGGIGKPITAYAAAAESEVSLSGEKLSVATGVLGGKTAQDASGFTFYYQMYDEYTSPKQVCISGYQYRDTRAANEKDRPVSLYLPTKIEVEGEPEPYYEVVGVNGGVFKNCQDFSSVIFGTTYKWVGKEAFMNCGLSGITFNSGLQTISENAFYGCPSLKEVNIGINVTAIGTGAFANCRSLEAISVDPSNLSYCTEGYVLYNKDKTELVQWPAALKNGYATVTTVTIGSAQCPVRTILGSAFEGCVNLQTIEGFYSTVTTICDRAFYGCSSLTSVKMPDTVRSIGSDVFTNCSSGLVLACSKDSYAEIYAKNYGVNTSVTCTVRFFNGNELVKTQEVPFGSYATAPVLDERSGYTLMWDKEYTNVQQNLDVYASWKQNYTVTFKDAYSGQVTQVTSYYGGAATPPVWTRQGYILGWDTTAYAYVTKDLTVNAVWLISMTDQPITDEKPQLGDTRTIGYITYQVTRTTASDPRVKAVACTKPTLTSVTIPDNITFGGVTYKVTNIGVNAFRSMPKLTKLTIGKNVVKINRAAFYNCPKLKTITISSKKLTTVVEKAFSKTYVKAKVNVPNAYIKTYKSYLQDAGLSVYATVY